MLTQSEAPHNEGLKHPDADDDRKIVDYRCSKLKAVQIGKWMKAYSVAIGNELCFFAALALLTRRAEIGPELPDAGTALNIAIQNSVTVNNVRGHPIEYVKKVCSALRLACIDWQELVNYHLQG